MTHALRLRKEETKGSRRRSFCVSLKYSELLELRWASARMLCLALLFRFDSCRPSSFTPLCTPILPPTSIRSNGQCGSSHIPRGGLGSATVSSAVRGDSLDGRCRDISYMRDKPGHGKQVLPLSSIPKILETDSVEETDRKRLQWMSTCVIGTMHTKTALDFRYSPKLVHRNDVLLAASNTHTKSRLSNSFGPA